MIFFYMLNGLILLVAAILWVGQARMRRNTLDLMTMCNDVLKRALEAARLVQR